MPGLEDMKSKFAPAVKASRGAGGRHGKPFELPILPGAGTRFFSNMPGPPPKPVEELIDITTPDSRMGGVDVNRRVMKKYKPISKVLKDRHFGKPRRRKRKR